MSTPTNVVREYIEKLSDDVIVSIIDSYEKWEREGTIGDEPLRVHAKLLMDEHAKGVPNILFWMEDLAFESYKVFAKRYIASRL